MSSLPAAVATGHPAAADAAVDILRAGGSAMDAAIAADAVMGVVEPLSTGVGGDVLAMASVAGRSRAYNGSGRAPGALEPAVTTGQVGEYAPNLGGLAVTVPGTVRAWWDLHLEFGALPWTDVLAPAVSAATEGFHVGAVAAGIWAANTQRLDPVSAACFRAERPPAAGAVIDNPELARTLRLISESGPAAFYEGDLAGDVAGAVQGAGGSMTTHDLLTHHGDWLEPLSCTLDNHELATLPPNCQGLVVLVAAALLERQGRFGGTWSPELPADYAAALDQAFAVALDTVADPAEVGLPDMDELVAAAGRKALHGPMPYGPGTVFTAVARGGDLVALVSSICDRFGSGVGVPHGGFVLQSRARGFVLDPRHPNGMGPGKRPYHTIVPTIVQRDGQSSLALGVVGGTMQPQGQLQILGRFLSGELALEEAVAAPRFRLLGNGEVALEPGFHAESVDALRARGYRTLPAGATDFGGAQAVALSRAGPVAATDPRKDGRATVIEVEE